MTRIIIVILSCCITSCVTVAPVINPNNEISLFGVSSLPPQNGNWVLLTATGYQMNFARSGDTKNESLVANVILFQLPELATDEEFLSHIIQARAAEPSIGRFEIQENKESLSPLNGATCVTYHSIAKDKAAQIQDGKTAEMLLENIGYNCIHPRNPTVGINIEYSLRHYPDTSYPSFIDNANAFFNNIKFTKF